MEDITTPLYYFNINYMFMVALTMMLECYRILKFLTVRSVSGRVLGMGLDQGIVIAQGYIMGLCMYLGVKLTDLKAQMQFMLII